MNADFIWIAVTTVVEGIIAFGSGTRSIACKLVLCNSDISVELTIGIGNPPLQIVYENLIGVRYSDENI